MAEGADVMEVQFLKPAPKPVLIVYSAHVFANKNVELLIENLRRANLSPIMLRGHNVEPHFMIYDLAHLPTAEIKELKAIIEECIHPASLSAK